MPQTLQIPKKEKKKLFSFKKPDAHVKDISFANLFWKKFAIRLFILSIISALIIPMIIPLIVEFNRKEIDNRISNVSLELAQMVTSDMPDDRIHTTTNVSLAKIQEDFENNPFITESSITAYNMDNGEVIAKSYSIAVIESDDIMEQWRKKAQVEAGDPIVHISKEIEDFCIKHSDSEIRIDKLCYVNAVLIPVDVTAYDHDGDEIETCSTMYSSTATVLTSYWPIILKIVGNDAGDPIYKAMDDIKYKVENEKISIEYQSFNYEKMELLSKEFTVGQHQIQVDCGYQINFWAGALLYILLGEGIAILGCAIIALFNTKESLSILR